MILPASVNEQEQKKPRIRCFLREPHPDYHSFSDWKRRCAEFGKDAIPVCIEVLHEGSESMQEQLTAILCLQEHGYKAGADWEFAGGERKEGPVEGYWIVPPGEQQETVIVPRIHPTAVFESERAMWEAARHLFGKQQHTAQVENVSD